MTPRTKRWLIVGGVLVLIVASILFGQWRASHQAAATYVKSEETRGVAESTAAPQPTEALEIPQSASTEWASDEASRDVSRATVCGDVAGPALSHYFTAADGEDDWRETLNGMLSDVGRKEQDTIDPWLIRPQEMLGFPAAKGVEDPNALQMHCEGTSSLTGWMIALSRTAPGAPWLIDSIRAMETNAGYFAPSSLEEETTEARDV